MDLDLGDVVNHRDGTRSISMDLEGIRSARSLIQSGNLKTSNGNDNLFARFLRAAVEAHDDGRLERMERLYRRKILESAPRIRRVGELNIEVLGPVTTRETGSPRLAVFPDPHDVSPTNPEPAPSESHTINGNSIVLKLTYGSRTFLFGGDLNQPSQHYLEAKYQGANPFRADVNKACHHGSSDFDIRFLKSVEPSATVFSSGDNGSYDHPMPDAMGSAARHSRGDYPLVFSTELARDNKTSGDILLGHINARCNGRALVMAQRKEKAGSGLEWHTFSVPYEGPFGGGH